MWYIKRASILLYLYFLLSFYTESQEKNTLEDCYSFISGKELTEISGQNCQLHPTFFFFFFCLNKKTVHQFPESLGKSPLAI